MWHSMMQSKLQPPMVLAISVGITAVPADKFNSTRRQLFVNSIKLVPVIGPIGVLPGATGIARSAVRTASLPDRSLWLPFGTSLAATVSPVIFVAVNIAWI
jgi:hypothetical protein